MNSHVLLGGGNVGWQHSTLTDMQDSQDVAI